MASPNTVASYAALNALNNPNSASHTVWIPGSCTDGTDCTGCLAPACPNVNQPKSIATLTSWCRNKNYVDDNRSSYYFIFKSSPEMKLYYDNMIDEHARLIDVTTAIIGEDLIGVVMLEQPRKFKTVFSHSKTRYIVIGQKQYVDCQEYLDSR